MLKPFITEQVQATVISQELKSRKITFKQDNEGKFTAFLDLYGTMKQINWSHEKCLEMIKEKNAKWHVNLDISGQKVKLSVDFEG